MHVGIMVNRKQHVLKKGTVTRFKEPYMVMSHAWGNRSVDHEVCEY